MADGGGALEHLRYRVVCAAFHQPLLLRKLAETVRAWPGLSSLLPVAAGITAVRAVLEREASFTHDHYVPVMIDGPFLIGEPAGEAHAEQRGCMKGLLPSPAQVAQASAEELDRLLPNIAKRLDEGKHFDLIDDYMTPLVWAGIRASYGDDAAQALDKERHALLDAVRWLGAQLLIGSVATPEVRQRALRSAAVVGAAFGRADPELLLDARWAALPFNAWQRQRVAIGLLWVGHPATTQSGALMMQELLQRPQVYRRLRAQARSDGADAARLPSVRERLREHVLELLRFRPPFPILARQVPRAALFPIDDKQAAQARAGSISALAIGALHDPLAQREDPAVYAPGRHFHDPENRYLMFGAGARRCIAREQVIEILVTALAGLLALDAAGRSRPLRYAHPRWRRIVYDGPVIAHMPLRF